VQSGLASIADQLGAKIGSYMVSIGQYDGKWRVSTSGQTGEMSFGKKNKAGKLEVNRSAWKYGKAFRAAQLLGWKAGEFASKLGSYSLEVTKDGKATRVGFKIQADGTKVRVAKRSGAEI